MTQEDEIIKRLNELKNTTDSIMKELSGDEFGNEGVTPKLKRVEKRVNRLDNIVYIVIGVVSVLSVLVGIVFKIGFI